MSTYVTAMTFIKALFTVETVANGMSRIMTNKTQLIWTLSGNMTSLTTQETRANFLRKPNKQPV